ncbi:hypothetical protein Bca52824_011275 [Brassica carinata]|uniref:Uncharacterized protein n=1 Tax=Brassica carinata TaxID=52824 RepID=A0A8X7WFZ6_BRACI|nr:hypothetical protein Bca52824_011275 [Brassica carinata]
MKVVPMQEVEEGDASGRKKGRSESTNIADASVGVDNQEMSNNDSSREVAQPDNAYNPPNIAEGGLTPPPNEPVLSKDPAPFESQSAVPTTSDAQEEHHKFPDVEEVPTAGLNLLATMGGYFVEEIEEVEETVEGGVEKEAEDIGKSENDSMVMVLYGKPTAYVLPSEVALDSVCYQQVCHESHNVGNPAPRPPIPEKKEASPTNSEDYKTPPEHDILSDYCTPDVAKVGKRRYQKRSATIQAGEGKSIMTSSNKVEQGRGKRIRKREFSIIIGGIVSNQFFLSLARPTNWVSTEHIHVLMNMLWQRHGETYLGKRIAFMDYSPLSCILSMYPQFEEAACMQKFDWGGAARSFVYGASLLIMVFP